MPYRRGDKWVGRIKVQGKQVPCGTFATKREARAAEEERRSELKVKKSRVITVGEFGSNWPDSHPFTRKGKRRKPSTMEHYRERISLFIDDFKDVPMCDFDRPKARDYAVSSPSRVATVSAMYSDAMDDGHIDRNVWVGFGPSVNRDSNIEALTETELYEVADCALRKHKGGYGLHFRAMFLFAAWTGVRPGELFALERKHIQGDELFIEAQLTRKWGLTSPKNGLTRTVVCLPQAQEALKDVAMPLEGPIFRQKRGAPFSIGALHSYWGPVRDLAGFPDLKWYDATKDFCASHLAAGGASGQAIGLQLGHTDNGQTAFRHYIHTYKEEARAEILAAAKRSKLTSLEEVKERKAING